MYPLRMIILYDPGLFTRQSKALENRIEKTKEAFKELEAKLNKYNLKTKDAIDKACTDILTKYQTVEFFEYTISNAPESIYKNVKRGRPAVMVKNIVKYFSQSAWHIHWVTALS